MESKTSEKAASSSSGASFDPVELFDSGGIFYLEDLPINSEFGIDYESWRIGEKFRGVKMIPPGVHFIYYSVADKYGQLGMRSGFFHEFALGEALVMRWNRAEECVVSKQLTPEQMENFQRRRRELDPSLGSYPFDHYKRWISLTNHVSPALIKALTPKSGVITSETSLIGKTFKKGQHHDDKKKEDESMSKISSTSSSINDAAEMESKKFNMNCLKSAPMSLKEAEKDLPEMKHDETCEINFTKMPTQSYPIGSSSNDITKHSIDLSYKLDLFVKDQHKNMLLNNEDESANIDNLLGELQFAFVCFLVGNVYDGFEQWKSILNLVCNCEKAIEIYPGFYLKLVNALYYQLGEMPLDFFTDITTSNNFLVVHLHNLFENIKESSSNDSNEKLKRRCDQFKNYLQQKYNFDFEEEPDEYAPVICEEADL